MNNPEDFELETVDTKVILFFVGIIFAIAILSAVINIYTDYLWFESLDLGGYFVKIISYKLELFGIVFVIATIIFALNRFAMHISSKEFMEEPLKIPFWPFLAISLFVAFIFSSKWLNMVYFLYGEPFNLKDPIFNLDVSFYVFKIPFIKDLLAIFLVTLIISIGASVAYYLYVFRWVKTWEELREIFPSKGYIHFSILIAFLILLTGAYFYLYRFELLSSQFGVVSGAGYTDVNIRMPILLLMSLFSLLMAGLAIYSGFKGDFSPLSLVVVAFILIVFIGLVAFPTVVQKIRVEPNELSLEEQYIGNSIEFTRYAYGLDNVEMNLYPVSENLTVEDIEENKGIINNIRLWDWRPLLSTYRQKQQIRTYYQINDVDVDRYDVNGEYTQVLISARELVPSLLQPTAQTWVNQHLIYTHGYGVIASPVNRVSEEGAPELIIYDIPPVSSIPIERPEIYYGESMDNFVIVNTGQKEFDYPSGGGNVFTTYEGSGGVKVDSYLKKLLFSLRFGDVNLLLSSYITDESRILMHRDVKGRVDNIAPFLSYDMDPYVAVIDGQIYWIIDAYTMLDNFPYSETSSMRGNYINYLRNPVKVFINAYDGSLKYYVMDADEPVLKTMENAFPELFTSGTDMSEEERKHIRYPIDLFWTQASVYSIYHMEDSRTFYNREDVWDIPYELFEEGRKVRMEPYYVILTLSRGEPEFVLMLPFTPKGRDNIISWMAARCDINYGELVLYEFPKGSLVYGPMQIEARIDQDPDISQTFTLWGQVGSRLTRGNLLVIPIENSIFYVEPVYLRAENAEIPELRGVIVSYRNTLTMQPTLSEAIEVVFGKSTEEPPVPVGEAPGGALKDGEDIPSLVGRSLEIYERALKEVESGNWSGFGQMLQELGDTLKELNSSVREEDSIGNG